MKRQQLLALLAGFASNFALQAQEPPATAAAPPPNEIRFDAATERAFDHTGKHLSVSHKPDGTTLTEFNGSFQNVTVARIGADGKVETFCTTDQQAALRFMAGEVVETETTTRLESPAAQHP
jgi:hypothetical protein